MSLYAMHKKIMNITENKRSGYYTIGVYKDKKVITIMGCLYIHVYDDHITFGDLRVDFVLGLAYESSISNRGGWGLDPLRLEVQSAYTAFAN